MVTDKLTTLCDLLKNNPSFSFAACDDIRREFLLNKRFEKVYTETFGSMRAIMECEELAQLRQKRRRMDTVKRTEAVAAKAKTSSGSQPESESATLSTATAAPADNGAKANSTS